MKVRKETILTNESDTYYIELGNAYYLLAELSANLIQADQPTDTDSQFKTSAAIKRHEKKNDKINKYTIENRHNDEVLINAAIKLAENERNVMDKHNTTKERQVTINETQTDTKKTIRKRSENTGNAFSTATHRRINSITRDGKHVHFRKSPTIVTYH